MSTPDSLTLQIARVNHRWHRRSFERRWPGVTTGAWAGEDLTVLPWPEEDEEDQMEGALQVRMEGTDGAVERIAIRGAVRFADQKFRAVIDVETQFYLDEPIKELSEDTVRAFCEEDGAAAVYGYALVALQDGARSVAAPSPTVTPRDLRAFIDEALSAVFDPDAPEAE